MRNYTSYFTNLPQINKIIFFIGLMGIILGILGSKLFPDENLITFFDNVHWTFSIFAAAVLSGLGYLHNRSTSSSKTSLWFFIGFTGYLVGQIVWDIQSYFSYSKFPSPSDFFYLWLGPSITIALFYELRLHHEKVSKPTFLLDLLGLTIAALTLILVSYLPRGTGMDFLSMIVMISYPITLMIPVIMLVLMILSMRLYVNAHLSLFLMGITITAVSWMHWNSMALDAILLAGSWFNVLFSISILMAGLAVSNWRLTASKSKKYDRFCQGSLRVLPIITVILSSVTIIIIGSDTLATPFTKQMVYVGAGIVILIAIIRQSHLLHDKESMQKETLDRLSLATIYNGIGIWDWNLQTMEMVWDESMFTLYHLRREDFSGAVDAWEKSLHPDDKADSQKAVELALSGKKPFDTEFRIIWPNGEIRHIKAAAKIFSDDKGKPLRMLGTNVDITELRTVKEELIIKDKLLMVQSRQAAMGEMISMIAHQWRQPLNAISTAVANMQVKIELKLLKLEDKDEKFILNEVNNINRYTQNLSTTIDDFRNFYKPNKKLETLALKDICRKSLDIIKNSLSDNNINVIEDYGSNDTFEMYSNEMIQVVINVLKNALDNFLEKDIKEPYIKISTTDKVLFVCDNGGGISDDTIDKVFDPYFSTKDEKNGTGLGLYMSKIIVEEHHNASFTVSNTDDGACFSIVFK